MHYCTYLTIYSGNKMPQFYIGRTTVAKIRNGYRGTVTSKRFNKIWLDELKDNPQLFKTKILTVHATKEESALKEEFFHKKFNVHKNPMYINQATSTGTFYADISGKNNPWYGKSRSGELNPMYGRKHSQNARDKMSLSGKGKHSQPKTESFKKTLKNLYEGKSYEERFGVERSKEIKAKLSKPKSIDHIQKIKDNPYHSNRPKIKCLHCQKEVSASNLKRWHNDKCKSLKIVSNPS